MLATLRVASVPAAPLLTGCGRSDLSELQGRDEEQGFTVRTRNRIKGSRPTDHSFTGTRWRTRRGWKEAFEGCLGLLHGKSRNDTSSVERDGLIVVSC
jgi:hypothetical protein